MLLENEIFKNTYVANGSVTEFAFRFPILDASHIKVSKGVIDHLGVETSVGVPRDQYSVKGVGSPQGGTVVFTTAPVAGTKLAITRNVPVTQVTQYTELDNFPAESHENALTKLTMICQQLLENISRCLYFPETSAEDPQAYLNKWQVMYAEVLQAYEKIMLVRGEWFNYSITPFTTVDGQLVYDLLPDNITLDPLNNNILLIMNDVVQEPDVDYSITGVRQITFKENPGDGLRVWGTSCFSWSNPDIRAVLEKALVVLQEESLKQQGAIKAEGDNQVAIVHQQAKPYVDRAWAWAESPDPPDPNDPNSKSAKTWAYESGEGAPLATKEAPGRVQIGDYIDVTPKGIISVSADYTALVETKLRALETRVDELIKQIPQSSGGLVGDFRYSYQSEIPGWLLCDGSIVSRKAYPALFALIGNKFGPIDGEENQTFQLPDLRGKFLMGAEDSTWQVWGSGFHGGEIAKDVVDGTKITDEYQTFMTAARKITAGTATFYFKWRTAASSVITIKNVNLSTAETPEIVAYEINNAIQLALQALPEIQPIYSTLKIEFLFDRRLSKFMLIDNSFTLPYTLVDPQRLFSCLTNTGISTTLKLNTKDAKSGAVLFRGQMDYRLFTTQMDGVPNSRGTLAVLAPQNGDGGYAVPTGMYIPSTYWRTGNGADGLNGRYGWSSVSDLSYFSTIYSRASVVQPRSYAVNIFIKY